MVSVFFLLLVAFCLDWAKSCKPVNYKFKVYNGMTEYGYGCKKGCVGYRNNSGSPDDGTKDVNGHTEQAECIECKKITPAWIKEIYNSPGLADDVAKDEAKDWCGSTSCYWKKGKCVAGSCPVQAAAKECNTRFGHEFADGKCKKVKGDKCKARGYTGSIYKESATNWNDIDVSNEALCKDLASYYHSYSSSGPNSYYGQNPFDGDDVKKCKFECEHPAHYYVTSYPADYTKIKSKQCTKVLGCMYTGGGIEEVVCSALAVWAFIVILVVAILVFVAIIVVIVIIILKLCGGKSTKVDPAADKASAPTAKNAPQASAPPATQAPPPEVGPYVVIKLGKQESKTKKVESAAWGQSIVFTGLGAEDDDVVFELHDNSDELLGSTDVRIPDYVNAKKRAAVTLKNGEAVIGILEVDIEIQVQEEPEVKITGVFFVDKFAKAV